MHVSGGKAVTISKMFSSMQRDNLGSQMFSKKAHSEDGITDSSCALEVLDFQSGAQSMRGPK